MRVTINDIARLHREQQRIVMVTAYDYTSAVMINATDIPLILVGDSLGMVVQGQASTIPVTLEDMIYHIRAVLRGAQRPLVIGDMPFMSYATPEQALASAARLMREGGCQSVKLEGGTAFAPIVRQLVQAGIPVMGHLGFTPQSVNQIGMRVQGKKTDHARQLLADALALQEAGAWAIVLELIPAPLAEAITARLAIPTIGIGAGVDCSGEVQVWHDILGLYRDFVPRHTKRYRSLADEIVGALNEYAADVRTRSFPAAEHSATMDAAQLEAALNSSKA